MKRTKPLLTREEILSFFDYDKINGMLIWKRHWYHNKQYLIGRVAGTLDGDGYRIVRLHEVGYRIHRLIWFIENGNWPIQIDHKNGIRTDNKIDNLKSSTARLNCQNKFHHRSGRLMGATQVKNGRWHSQIQIKNKRVHLGTYDTEFEAHWKYVLALSKAAT